MASRLLAVDEHQCVFRPLEPGQFVAFWATNINFLCDLTSVKLFNPNVSAVGTDDGELYLVIAPQQASY